MQVIKLGGSLEKSNQLIKSLDVIGNMQQAEKRVIVTGGGRFADQVRLSQQRWLFNEAIAHEMAILAMQQMALLCQGLRADFQCVNSIMAIKQSKHSVIIWSPDVTELNNGSIPKNWSVTSDSLAAWLAIQLHADQLTLIKSATCNPSHSIKQLSEDGIVDAYFPHCIKNAPFSTKIINVETFYKAFS